MRQARSWVLIVHAFTLVAGPCRAEGVITTIAGGAKFQVTGIGGPATNVPLGTIKSVAVDPQGNVYAVDASNFIVVRIATNGVLTAVAGNGTGGAEGDGGPATQASFRAPKGLAADASGNIFLSDGFRVRKVSPDGIITTVAGTDQGPHTGYSGEGGPAIAASLSWPDGLAVDNKGNLYIADGNRLLKVDAQGIISTVAGSGTGPVRDGIAATSVFLIPNHPAVDSQGSLYFTNNSQVLRVGANGILTVIAGTTGFGYSGDGGPAVLALLNGPSGVAVNGAGEVLIADGLNHRVRKITPAGIIQTVAGNGAANFTGDEGPSSLATLDEPAGIAVDSKGNIYVGDSANYRVRQIDPAGKIHTYAGNGNFGFAGEGVQARLASLNDPGGVVVDSAGIVYISDTRNHRVRRVTPDGVTTTIAGGAAHGFAGDGGPGPQALLNSPVGLALDTSGNLYIADSGNRRVRRVDANGIISTFAGGGAPTSGNGDGGLATSAQFDFVRDVAIDIVGNLYVVDGFSIRKISQGGIITTFFQQLPSIPVAVALDAAGFVYVSTIAQTGGGGGGLFRVTPDGKSFTQMRGFGNVSIDGRGNLFGSSAGQVIRVATDGTQAVIAGAGPWGFSGDDGPAILATLGARLSAALDSSGNLYIADSDNNRIRKVFLNPTSGLFEPKLQTTLQPGYYTATVTLGQGEHPGYWGMEILASVGTFDGGLNLGGTLQNRALPPGFGGFFLPSPQSAHIHVNAQAVDGAGATGVALGVRLLDVNKKPVTTERFGGTSVDFTEPLPSGYYTIEARGGETSPRENFQMSVEAPRLSGGVVVGGYAGTNTVGFGGFYLTAPQQVVIRVLGQPSYGADGAGGVKLTLYDVNRNVVATVP